MKLITPLFILGLLYVFCLGSLFISTEDNGVLLYVAQSFFICMIVTFILNWGINSLIKNRPIWWVTQLIAASILIFITYINL